MMMMMIMMMVRMIVPMVVTVVGMLILVIGHNVNCQSLMVVVPVGNVTDVKTASVNRFIPVTV